MCKPIVEDNLVSVVWLLRPPSLSVHLQVLIESGPICWSDTQWWALEEALDKGEIEVVRVKPGVPLQ